MLSSVLRPSSVLAQIGPQHHICCLRILSVLTWFLSCLFVQSASVLPLFDSSPRVTIPVSSNSSRLHSSVHPLLRWDSFHFTHIAQHGYVYEHEWAFLSGAPAVMRITALMLRLIGIRSWRSEGTLGAEDVLLGGALATCLCNTTTIFYRLTLHHLRSPSLAFLASLLSLLPSSPATLRLAGYSEPFFTYLSYKGKSFVDLRGSHRVQRRKRHALLCSIPMVRSILLFRTCRVLSLKWHHALWVHSLGLTHRPFPCYSKGASCLVHSFILFISLPRSHYAVLCMLSSSHQSCYCPSWHTSTRRTGHSANSQQRPHHGVPVSRHRFIAMSRRNTGMSVSCDIGAGNNFRTSSSLHQSSFFCLPTPRVIFAMRSSRGYAPFCPRKASSPRTAQEAEGRQHACSRLHHFLHLVWHLM